MDYARVLKLPQYFRNLQRLSEIVRVLIRHGFGDLVDRLGLRSYLESGLQAMRIQLRPERPLALDISTRLRLACEELGPTFIKFAQLVATRPDVFPLAVVREFRKLEDRVTAFPTEQAKQVIEKDLSRSLDRIFSAFDEIPLAAASIAQVHRATLLSGQRVVVKVQRPSIERIIETDIDILRGLATLIEENIPETRIFSPLELIEEFARGLRRECDFRREAFNMRKFAENFSSEPAIIVPKVFNQFSSRRVLTEELIEGVKIDDLDSIRALDLKGQDLAAILSRIVLKSIFEDRFFHADPHPGNLFVTKEGRICLVDYGAVGRLDRSRIRFILQFLVAVLNNDLDKTVRVLKESGMTPNALDEAALKNQIAEIFDVHLSQPLGNMDISHLLADIFEVVQRYGIRPPPDLLLIGKSLTTLEHIGALLDPQFDLIKNIKPYLLQRYLATLADRKFYVSHAADVADTYRRLIAESPERLRVVLRKLANDEIVVNSVNKDLSSTFRHQNSMLNRALTVFMGVIFAALGILILSFRTPHTHLSLAYSLIALGALLLLVAWLAMRKTGGPA